MDPPLWLFNQSLENGVFPQILKYSEMAPIPKIEKITVPTHLQLIAILSSLSKLFELIIKDRMLTFLLKYKLVSKKQCL